MSTTQFKEPQIDRLWVYKRDVADAFYKRLNFFLVFESVLLATVGVLYGKPSRFHLLIWTISEISSITVLGIALTLCWIYIQARQKYFLDQMNEKLKPLVPEYKLVLDARCPWPVSSLWLETFAVPGLVCIIWIVLLLSLL